MENCKELFLDDIVKVEMYKTSQVSLAIPVQVPGLTTMKEPTITGDALLTIDSSGTAEVDMTENPTLKVTSKRQGVGQVFTHEFSATLNSGFETAQAALADLASGDAHLIYTTQSGERKLSATLPNCTGMVLTDNLSSAHTMALKVTISSLSGLIGLTE